MTTVERITAADTLKREVARLRAELRVHSDELRACRGLLIDAIEAERRRIERDLHDGLQGRLVSVAMSLGLLEVTLPGHPEAARPIARQARREVVLAIAELRELSQGINPALLAERGLRPALAELCDGMPLPISLDASVERRLSPTVEAAAYFVVKEALTNTIKHARARVVRVALTCSEQFLRIEVSDDGIGGATSAGGSGLGGLTDRVEALNGRLVVSSPASHGTTLRAEIPCAAEIRSPSGTPPPSSLS